MHGAVASHLPTAQGDCLFVYLFASRMTVLWAWPKTYQFFCHIFFYLNTLKELRHDIWGHFCDELNSP